MSDAKKELLTTAEALTYLGGISKQTLYRWARACRIERLVRGNVVRWPIKELNRIREKYTKQLR